MSTWDEPATASASFNPSSYLYPSKSIYLASSNRVSPTSNYSNEALMNKSSVHPWETTSTLQSTEEITTSTTKTVTSNKPPTSSTSKLGACLKSSKFHFTLLGVFLGLVLSLAAIIPIVIFWQLSLSTTTSAPQSTSSTGSPVSGSLRSTIGYSGCNMWYCEQNVNFTSNMTITALSAAITIQRGGYNITSNNGYTNFPFTPNMTVEMTSSQLIFRFFFTSGQLTPLMYIIAAQFYIPGVNRTSSADTYSISATNICGQVNTVSGYF